MIYKGTPILGNHHMENGPFIDDDDDDDDDDDVPTQDVGKSP